METQTVVKSLGALAQGYHLEIFRALVVLAYLTQNCCQGQTCGCVNAARP